MLAETSTKSWPIYMSDNVSTDTRPWGAFSAQDPSILVLGEGSQSNPACPVILFTDLLHNFRI